MVDLKDMIVTIIVLIIIVVYIKFNYDFICHKNINIESFASQNDIKLSEQISLSDLDIYLINLDRNKDRLAAFIEQYMKSDLRNHEIKRLNAIDGQSLTNIEEKVTPKALDEVLGIEKTGYRTKHYQLTRGALGCYLSHMKVYQLIANGQSPYGLIFEDDVIINPNIFKKLNTAIQSIPGDWDMLLLSCHCIVCEQMDIYYDTGKFFWLHCYIVKKTSADSIVEYLKNKKIGKQIDSELSDMIGQGLLKVYCLKESLCKQGNIFQTTVQTPLKVVPGINPYALS